MSNAWPEKELKKVAKDLGMTTAYVVRGGKLKQAGARKVAKALDAHIKKIPADAWQPVRIKSQRPPRTKKTTADTGASGIAFAARTRRLGSKATAKAVASRVGALTAIAGEQVLAAIAAGDGSTRRAAHALGVHEVTLHNRIRALGMRDQVQELRDDLKAVLGMAPAIARLLHVEDGAGVSVVHRNGWIVVTVNGRKRPSFVLPASMDVLMAVVRRLRRERPDVKWNEVKFTGRLSDLAKAGRR